ncbi:hypothetical protein B296_00046261 [Ensete ventricosum]|uniref:Uncharacterized protein n=1 Tax=Ensete ventricosum TaxID=4639 RepID=A0A426Z4H2_ENSVE|nr:hypothetical protein B296_00046261 [Ensete ventricosum]
MQAPKQGATSPLPESKAPAFSAKIGLCGHFGMASSDERRTPRKSRRKIPSEEEDKPRERSSLSTTTRCGEQDTFKNPTSTEASSSPIDDGFVVYRQRSLVFDRMPIGVEKPRVLRLHVG